MLGGLERPLGRPLQAGPRLGALEHEPPLDQILARVTQEKAALVAIDGVYSMSGELPPLRRLNEVCLANGAVLYVDDAPSDIQLPSAVELEVTQTEPGLRGDTASGGGRGGRHARRRRRFLQYRNQ